MKPLIVFSDVTIDGFMAGPDNDLDFMVDDPQLEDELTGMLMSVADTIVVGRKAFPDMAAHWTTADGDLAAWLPLSWPLRDGASRTAIDEALLSVALVPSEFPRRPLPARSPVSRHERLTAKAAPALPRGLLRPAGRGTSLSEVVY